MNRIVLEANIAFTGAHSMILDNWWNWKEASHRARQALFQDGHIRLKQ